MDFSHFKYSSDNIPKGFGFSHFSALHFFWLFLCIAVAVGCCLLYRKLKPKGRRNMLWIMTALLLGDEIWKVAWLLSLGLFTHSYLPFHLCSINIFLFSSLRSSRIKLSGISCTRSAFQPQQQHFSSRPGQSFLFGISCIYIASRYISFCL